MLADKNELKYAREDLQERFPFLSGKRAKSLAWKLKKVERIPGRLGNKIYDRLLDLGTSVSYVPTPERVLGLDDLLMTGCSEHANTFFDTHPPISTLRDALVEKVEFCATSQSLGKDEYGCAIDVFIGDPDIVFDRLLPVFRYVNKEGVSDDSGVVSAVQDYVRTSVWDSLYDASRKSRESTDLNELTDSLWDFVAFLNPENLEEAFSKERFDRRVSDVRKFLVHAEVPVKDYYDYLVEKKLTNCPGEVRAFLAYYLETHNYQDYKTAENELIKVVRNPHFFPGVEKSSGEMSLGNPDYILKMLRKEEDYVKKYLSR